MDLLTGKIIEQVYGKSIQHYKDYLKVETQKVITLLQKKEELEALTIEEKEKENSRLLEKGVKSYYLHSIPFPEVWIELSPYESLLNNIDNWNILDINITDYPKLDFKVAKIHNKFIDKMTDEIANKLMRGESII